PRRSHALRGRSTGAIMTRATPIIGTLVGLHVVILLAGFAAPYDPTAQARTIPFAPPARVHVVDTNGTFHVRPFVYGLVSDANGSTYSEDTSTRFPVRLLAHGATYSLLPGVTSDIHLFGVDEPGRIALIGTDGYGRDVLSRLLYGARVSIT